MSSFYRILGSGFVGGMLILRAIQGSAAPAVFDLSQDYSTNNNPGGAWSYGWKSTLSGALTLFNRHDYANQGGGAYFDFWMRAGPSVSASVWHNPSSITVTNNGGQSVFPPA